MISKDLAEFCESAVSVLIGTVDEQLVPDCIRVLGARVEAGGRELSVFQPVATAARTVANLRANGRVAVCFSRIADHRSIQVKGSLVELREADEEDRARIDRYRRGLADELAVIGLPLRVGLSLAWWPAWVVRLRVESLFVQTPGPGAGAPLAAGGGR